MKNTMIFAALILSMSACQTAPTTVKSDVDYTKAVDESKNNQSQKVDFLANEKLPNEEYIVKDSIRPDTVITMEYSEFVPEKKAKFRVQVFAGSAANGTKNFQQLKKDTLLNGDVYLVRDTTDQKWRVWVGNYLTHEEADKTKVRLIAAGYPDAWIHEMKGALMPSTELYWVQIGVFKESASANKAKSTVASRGTVSVKQTDKVFKVWVGGFDVRSKADELKKALQGTGYPGAFVVQGVE